MLERPGERPGAQSGTQEGCSDGDEGKKESGDKHAALAKIPIPVYKDPQARSGKELTDVEIAHVATYHACHRKTYNNKRAQFDGPQFIEVKRTALKKCVPKKHGSVVRF